MQGLQVLQAGSQVCCGQGQGVQGLQQGPHIGLALLSPGLPLAMAQPQLTCLPLSLRWGCALQRVSFQASMLCMPWKTCASLARAELASTVLAGSIAARL